MEIYDKIILKILIKIFTTHLISSLIETEAKLTNDANL